MCKYADVRREMLLSTGLRPVLGCVAPLELFIMRFKAQRADISQHRSQACARQVRILLKAISMDV